MAKYVVVDERRNTIFTTEWNKLGEALIDAEGQWHLLCKYDQEHTDNFYVLESANPDVDAENHLDGNPVKVYVENGVNLFKLQKEFDEECEEIALECEEEGYPAHGSNYDLRVEQLMESDYYEPLFRQDVR